MTSTKKSGFDSPSPAHIGRTPSPLLWTSTRENTHSSLETASTMTYQDLKLKFDYMIVIYLNCTIIYISNLYHGKFPLFIPSKDEILLFNFSVSTFTWCLTPLPLPHAST